jgi:hypothetical protein
VGATAADSQVSTGELAHVLDRARLQVLRWTLGICLLIACGNLVGAIAGFTDSGNRVVGHATTLAAAWCGLWILAIGFPRVTARCFARWRITALVFAVTNAATVAVTNGMDSPLLSVCMYAGWVTSVVTTARAAIVMSVGVAASVLVGYVLAGAFPLCQARVRRSAGRFYCV